MEDIEIAIVLGISFPFVFAYIMSVVIYLGYLGRYATGVGVDPQEPKARRYHMIRMRLLGSFGFILALLVHACVICFYFGFSIPSCFVVGIVLAAITVILFISYIVIFTKNKKLRRYYFLSKMLEENPDYEDEFSTSDKYYQYYKDIEERKGRLTENKELDNLDCEDECIDDDMNAEKLDIKNDGT